MKDIEKLHKAVDTAIENKDPQSLIDTGILQAIMMDDPNYYMGKLAQMYAENNHRGKEGYDLCLQYLTAPLKSKAYINKMAAQSAWRHYFNNPYSMQLINYVLLYIKDEDAKSILNTGLIFGVSERQVIDEMIDKCLDVILDTEVLLRYIVRIDRELFINKLIMYPINHYKTIILSESCELSITDYQEKIEAMKNEELDSCGLSVLGYPILSYADDIEKKQGKIVSFNNINDVIDDERNSDMCILYQYLLERVDFSNPLERTAYSKLLEWTFYLLDNNQEQYINNFAIHNQIIEDYNLYYNLCIGNELIDYYPETKNFSYSGAVSIKERSKPHVDLIRKAPLYDQYKDKINLEDEDGNRVHWDENELNLLRYKVSYAIGKAFMECRQPMETITYMGLCKGYPVCCAMPKELMAYILQLRLMLPNEAQNVNQVAQVEEVMEDLELNNEYAELLQDPEYQNGGARGFSVKAPLFR